MERDMSFLALYRYYRFLGVRRIPALRQAYQLRMR